MSCDVGDETSCLNADRADEEIVVDSLPMASAESRGEQEDNGLAGQTRGNIIGRHSGRCFVGNKSTNLRAKLEGSRRSARECRARRKMRYQYLEEMVTNREQAIQSLRRELELYKKFCFELDEGRIPKSLLNAMMTENCDK